MLTMPSSAGHPSPHLQTQRGIHEEVGDLGFRGSDRIPLHVHNQARQLHSFGSMRLPEDCAAAMWNAERKVCCYSSPSRICPETLGRAGKSGKMK